MPAQGATVDHSLFAPSVATSAERAYVALSRGRHTNRIYATRDHAWIDAIADPRTHTLATDQHPALPDLADEPTGHGGLADPDVTQRGGGHRAAPRRPRWLSDAHPTPDRTHGTDRRQEPEQTIDLDL